MAYSQPWNEGTPLGTADAGTLDTIIQNHKVAMRERLEELIPDWANDGVQPKILLEGSARVLVDVIANRPATPQFEGQVFYATDTADLYVGVGAAWVQIVTGSADPSFHASVLASMTSNQTPANNTPTIINFGRTNFEVGGEFHDPVTNNSRITIPTAFVTEWSFFAELHLQLVVAGAGGPSSAAVKLSIKEGGTTVRHSAYEYNGGIPQGATADLTIPIRHDFIVSPSQFYELELTVNMSNPAGTPITVVSGIDESYWAAMSQRHFTS